MPEETKVVQQEPRESLVSEKETSFSIMMQKVLGENSFTPTEKQVDELLAQRNKVYGFIHEDKKIDSYDKKFYFIGALIASLVIIILVLFFAKEFLTQILSLLIGAFGGYGIGKAQKN